MNSQTKRALAQAPLYLGLLALGACHGKASGASGSGAAASAATPDIAGQYTIKGTNPGGGEYGGALAVAKRGGVYQFSWKSGANTYDGIGVQTQNTVGVAFATGSNGKGCSVVHYKVGANGSLSGVWGEWGQNAIGTETATRTGGGSGLDGHYTVTGTRLDGKSYKGSLTVAAKGAGYLFQWSTGDSSEGFGIRMGDVVSVGIGGAQCGFVTYEVGADGTLDGKWSSFQSKAIGTEVATKTK